MFFFSNTVCHFFIFCITCSERRTRNTTTRKTHTHLSDYQFIFPLNSSFCSLYSIQFLASFVIMVHQLYSFYCNLQRLPPFNAIIPHCILKIAFEKTYCSHNNNNKKPHYNTIRKISNVESYQAWLRQTKIIKTPERKQKN